jgi:hypothetical protein
LCNDKWANEAPPPPGFDPASVPEHLRVLEGRIAYIKIPSEDEAPQNAAEGAVLRNNVSAQVVTSENRTSIPFELMCREREFDRPLVRDQLWRRARGPSLGKFLLSKAHQRGGSGAAQPGQEVSVELPS